MTERPQTVRLRTPCCERTLRPAPFSKSATQVLDRTCNKCGQEWRVIAEPVGRVGTCNGFAHRVSWTKKSKIKLARKDSPPKVKP